MRKLASTTFINELILLIHNSLFIVKLKYEVIQPFQNFLRLFSFFLAALPRPEGRVANVTYDSISYNHRTDSHKLDLVTKWTIPNGKINKFSTGRTFGISCICVKQFQLNVLSLLLIQKYIPS